MRTSLAVGLLLVVLVVAPGAATATGGPVGAAADDQVPADATAQSPTAAGGDAVADEHDACQPVAGGPQREHPDNDTLGWENGCWYDDPLNVTVEDGLNGSELDAVVARTMARVEHVRGLEFNQTVPVEVVSRETYREQNRQQFENVSEAARLHQNAKFEALFFVGEDTDAIAEIEENRGGSVLGYYSPTQDRIVVISDNPDSLELDELTLAHELVHAVQDQQFNITRYNRSTTEEDKTTLGLVEGDARYTEMLYQDRCNGEWSCPSLSSGQSDVPAGFHWGLYFLNYQPYSDGPAFVAHVREAGGWEAVDDLYGNPPASSEQVIDPEKYPDEEPAEVTVADRSDARWRVLDVAGGPNYAEFGQAGISTMFVYPTYERSPVFVSAQEFQNSGSDLDPLDYDNDYSDGWAGDKLVPYVTDDSAATNETGYVWKTVWDSEADAREFEDAYARMLNYRGAQQVDRHVDTYRIPDDRRFGDAFHVDRTGDTVVVVNAPTVEEIRGVRAGAAPEVTPTTTPTATADDTAATRTPTDDENGVSPPPITTTSPGFGLAVALLAVVAGLLAVRRR